MEPKPNVNFPLAVSYNERGITGFTNISDKDQYKINLFYQPIRNSLSGKTTLYLTKRPAATSSLSLSGATNLEIWQLINAVGSDAAPTDNPWAIACSTTAGSPVDTRVVEGIDATTIISGISARAPVFNTGGFINNQDTRIIQISQSNVFSTHSTFYATSFSVWTQIVDAYTTHIHRGKVEVMDGFAFQLVSTNRIQNSNINTISTWPAGNFITREIIQDFGVGLAKLRNQILAFGYETVEMFYNGGLSPAPLVRIGHLTTRVGLQRDTSLSATEYYTVLGGRLYFNSNTLGAQVYDGSRFEKISTPAIDKILAERPPYSVDRISFQNEEAVAFRLSAIITTTQRALLFFPRVNEWFEWNSNIFKSVGNGVQFPGVGKAGTQTTTYALGTTTSWYDGQSEAFSSRIQFEWPSSDGTRQRMDMFGVIGDTEVSSTTSQLQVEFSDDDGQSYAGVRTIDMTENRKQITRCGAFHQRTVRLTHVGNTEIRLEKVVAHISK